MEIAILKTISIWVLILLLSIFLIPLIDMFITTLQVSRLRHKMRKELRKTVNLSKSKIQKELYDLIDSLVDDSFNIEK